MLLQVFAPCERPGAFEYEIYAQLLPGKCRRIAVAERPQVVSADNQVITVDRHRIRVTPIHRVKAKQVSKVLHVHPVVHSNQLQRRLIHQQLQQRASDSSETVDGDPGSHPAAPVRTRVSRGATSASSW